MATRGFLNRSRSTVREDYDTPQPVCVVSLSRVFELGFGMDLAWGVIGVVGAIASIALMVFIAAKGHSDRHAEDAAREFYDLHGHWPDEEKGVRSP